MGCDPNTNNRPEFQPAGESGVTCAAELIARRIARALDKLRELDLETADVSDVAAKRCKDELEKELQPLPSALGEILQWTVPSSLSGVLGQVLQLADVVAELSWDDLSPEQSVKLMARFNRLHRLVVCGLVEIGGLDGEALGVRHFTVRGDAHAEAIRVTFSDAA